MARYLSLFPLVFVGVLGIVAAWPGRAPEPAPQAATVRPVVRENHDHDSGPHQKSVTHAIFHIAPCERPAIMLCQEIVPAPCDGPCQPPIFGIDCACGPPCGEAHWDQWGPIPWQAFAQGEYVGPARLPHVPQYRLRPDDELEFIYRLTRAELSHSYQLEVGDVIRVESLVDPTLNREVTVQPDGTVDLLLIGA